MFSVITNIYNKKTKGPTLMELFTATGKLKSFFFFWQLEMFAPRVTRHTSIRYSSCCHTHGRACVATTWISYWCVPCHLWCTHRTPLVVKKKLFQFSCGCEQLHLGRSFGFLVINVCNHGERYETPCVFVPITLKMTTRVAETCRRLICNEITFVNASAFNGSLKISHIWSTHRTWNILKQVLHST
jgi:hypothetical protein